MRNVDLLSGCILLVFSILFLFWVIPAFVAGKPAALMPKLSVIWIAIFSVMLVYRGAKQGLTGLRSDGEEAALIDKMDVGTGESLPVIFLMVIWGVYIFLY